MLYENTGAEAIATPSGPLKPGEQRSFPLPPALVTNLRFAALAEAFKDGRLVTVGESA